MSGLGSDSVARARPVALLGFMASGKSAIGSRLAARLGADFVDLDALIEAGAGMSIARIFASEGEAAFRRLELEALRRCSRLPLPEVVACGGGIVTVPAARDLLASSFLRVWLDCPLELALDRLERDREERRIRPLAAGEDWRQRLGSLFESRLPLYRDNCDLVLEIRPSEGADELAERLAYLISALSGFRP